MTKHSQPVPLTLGAFFAFVTGYVLFSDVTSLAQITPTHVLSMSGMVAALTTGHMALPQFRHGNTVSGAILTVLFFAATASTVITAASRNSETAHGKVETSIKAAGDRKRAQADYDAAVAELAPLAGARTPQQVRASMETAKVSARVFKDTRECTNVVVGSDEHKACRPILDLCREMAGAIRKGEVEQQRIEARDKLDHLPVTVAANTGFHDAATILATAGLVRDIDAATDTLALVLPFLLVLTTEGCTLVFFHIGLPHGSERQEAVAPAAPVARQLEIEAARIVPPDRPALIVTSGASGKTRTPAPRSVPDCPAERPALPAPPACSEHPPDDPVAIELHILAVVADGRTIRSQKELAERIGAPRSTVSDALANLQRRGLIRRRIDGRCKIIDRAA